MQIKQRSTKIVNFPVRGKGSFIRKGISHGFCLLNQERDEELLFITRSTVYSK